MILIHHDPNWSLVHGNVSLSGILINKKGYKCFDPLSKQYFVSMNVTFFEGSPYYIDSHLQEEHHTQDGIPSTNTDFVIDLDPSIPTKTAETDIADTRFKGLVYSKQRLGKQREVPVPRHTQASDQRVSQEFKMRTPMISLYQVFDLLREQLWYRPNSGIYIKLIVMLGKCKQPEKAHTLFQAMIDEGCVVDREAFTALLSAYSRSGLFEKAFSILEQMKSTRNCSPDVYTYSILIKSCLVVHDFCRVKSLLSDMEVEGIRPNTVTYNTLIDSYGKSKKFTEMESLLMQMLRQRECEPDVWTMNSTLRAFGGSGQIEMMEKCYEKFQSAGIEPSIKTFNILLDSYGKTGNYDKMGAVMEYMQRYHFSWTIVTYNIVIDAFGKAGDIKQMEFLFRLMQSERIKPNCVTLCSIVRAYGLTGNAEKIAAILRFVENSDVTLDTVFFNCLVDAYGMMGCLAEMKGVLEMMRRRDCKPDRITYRTMIKAYSIGGMTKYAKKLQNELALL